MAKRETIITFKTITPLWTGDAWQDNNEIRPSALIGSLRFWFEVICYFSGICKNEDFNKISGRFEKEVNRENLKKFIQKNGNDINGIIKHLIVNQNIPLPSAILGTTNWKSLIEIKRIEYLDDYCFGNSLDLPKKICVNKSTYEINENRDCPNRSNNQWSVYFFTQPYFYGKFKVSFKVEELILESNFYPLITFMDKYGFWGGKWNIGYGRLKILEVKENNKQIKDWEKGKFIFSQISNNYEDKEFNSFVKTNILNLNELFQKNNEIKVLINQLANRNPSNSYNSFIDTIKELVKIKSQERAKFTNTVERHKIFGKTGNPRNLPYVPQGSKILPYIDEEQGQLKDGFLSIAGLLNLEGGNNE